MGGKKAPLQREFLWFFVTQHLGEVSQVTAAAAVRFSPSKFNNWRWHKDPSAESLKQISKNIRDKLGQKNDDNDVEADKFVDAFKFIRKVEEREAEVCDFIPELAHSFMREMRFIDTKGEPTDKLIRWLVSTPLPLVSPRYISREQAFTESETTSAIWLNPHNHYSLPLRGRDAELALLDQFMNSKESFKIAAVVAPSGAGKTRLVSQWAKPYLVGGKSAEWDAGFVESPNADLWSEENWQPSKNTLIIIDYTYNYADVIGALMKRFEGGAPYNIRLLVLDHVMPEKLHQDTAFRKGVPSLGFREANSELFFETWPIALHPISDNNGLLREIISAAADPFTEDAEAKHYKPDSPEVTSAADALMKIGAVEGSSAKPDQIKRRDAVRHPLFAALLGQMIRKNPKSDFSGMTRRDLVGHYFENERRLPWRDEAQDPNLGYWVGMYITAATLLRGVAINDILEFQDDPPETTKPVLEGEDFKILRTICGRFVSSKDRQVIAPFEPDILGETFVLKFLAERQTGTDYRALASILSQCSQSGKSEINVGSFLETIQRLVRNLINDDQELDDVKEAWSSLERFLDPKWFQEESDEMRQAVSISLGYLIRLRRKAGNEEEVIGFALNVKASDLAKASEGSRWLAAAYASIHVADCLLKQGRWNDQHINYFTLIFRNFVKRSVRCTSAIMLAAKEECLHAAKLFKASLGEDVDSIQDGGWTSLMLAAERGHVPTIAWLIDEGANLELKRVPLGWTAFLIACNKSNLDAARELKKRGADIHVIDEVGRNAAIHASSSGNVKVLHWLHQQGINIHITTRFGGNAATFASEGGHLEVLKWLHAKGVDIHASAIAGGNAVTGASWGGHLQVLKWLHAHDVDLHMIGPASGNAANDASYGGHLDVLKWLHAHDVDIHATKKNGGNSVNDASSGGHLEVLKWLHAHDVDLHAIGYEGTNAAIRASEGGHLEVLEWLHALDVDIHASAESLGNAAVVASRGGHLEVLKWLYAQGVDIHASALFGGNAATEASAGGHLEVLKWLYAQEVDIHARARFGGNAATEASACGHLEVLRWLHARGVDIHAKSRSGGNATTDAIVAGRFEVLKWLHAQQVDIVTKKSDGDATAIAKFFGFYSLLKWLEERGVN